MTNVVRKYVAELDDEGIGPLGLRNGQIGMLIVVGFTVLFWGSVCGIITLVARMMQ